MYHKFELSSIIRSILSFPHVPSYTHKQLSPALGAIRLVLLEPAPYLTSPVRCRIIETTWMEEKSRSLIGHSGYYALSYTWGDSNQDKRAIKVDGRSFQITKNLELALRYLRLQRKDVRLWVDSICINQDDIEERNEHVRHMRSIYSAAQETVIFLGEATDGSKDLMHAIIDAKSLIAKATTREETVKVLRAASGLSKQELVERAFEILRRPYWSRIWIFQEIIVSDNPWVQCGIVKLPWEEFCQCYIAILDTSPGVIYWGSGYDNEPKRRLEDVYWERRAYRRTQGIVQALPRWDIASGSEFNGRMQLLDLLVTKRGSQATDARDMIFAVEGIATKPKDWDPVSITYEKSAGFVYISLVEYLLKNDGSFEVLSHAGHHQASKKEPLKIPSWAPDWREPPYYLRKIIDWIPSPPTSRISRQLLSSHTTIKEDYGILACIGYKFSDIISITDTPKFEPAPGSIGRVLWNSKFPRKKLVKRGTTSLSSPNTNTNLSTVENLFKNSHPLIYRRKLAQTRNGVSCLVPGDTKVGDIICQFVGGTVPFVLRPVTKTGWVRKTEGIWSRWFTRFLQWIRWNPVSPDSVGDQIDLEILDSLKEKNRDIGDLDIGHYNFIGESFVDGLMNRDSHDGYREGECVEKAVFALH